MKFVEEILPELIAQHSCVVVPGFGGFVAKVQPAQIDFNKGTMVPPFRAVLFNRQLISDDGILIHSLSSKSGVDYDTTNHRLKEVVREWNATLSAGGRIEIDRLGVFYKDLEGKIQFEQDRFFNLLMSSYGLEMVRFVPTAMEGAVEETTVLESEIQTKPVQAETKRSKTILDPIPLHKKRRPLVRYAAAAVLLPIAFYSFWIPSKTDVLESGVLSLRDFNPFYSKQEGNYKPTSNEVSVLTAENEKEDLVTELEALPEEITVYSYKFTSDKFIPVQLKGDGGKQTPLVANDLAQPNAMNYIVGCFANKTNAENQVNLLKQNGLAAFILDEQNGLYRVSAGAALSEEGFNEIKTASNQLGIKGWVLK